MGNLNFQITIPIENKSSVNYWMHPFILFFYLTGYVTNGWTDRWPYHALLLVGFSFVLQPSSNIKYSEGSTFDMRIHIHLLTFMALCQ